ncbi:hypothetical protein IEQ44_12800 [Nocardioides sp. Y6]|uniref:Secreted protein n=1 Tax=Nocardioides malaquae TaxID=2773426 RepID=A0ABR9RWN2_9ACTN|nr:hypothetical protein [Nocardioides malaquae]MBE7325530.1 hypothetical protein [Nocardioides malaquae]
MSSRTSVPTASLAALLAGGALLLTGCGATSGQAEPAAAPEESWSQVRGAGANHAYLYRAVPQCLPGTGEQPECRPHPCPEPDGGFHYSVQSALHEADPREWTHLGYVCSTDERPTQQLPVQELKIAVADLTRPIPPGR